MSSYSSNICRYDCCFSLALINSSFTFIAGHDVSTIREILMCIDQSGGVMNRCAIVFGYYDPTTDDIIVHIASLSIYTHTH